jgi:hypothetical protein
MGEDTIRRAEEIARRAHAGQTDKGGVDYIEHPRRVAGYAAEAAPEGRLGEDAQVVGWLHDVVEDTGTTLAELRGIFSERICAAVDAMTQRAGEPPERYWRRRRGDRQAGRPEGQHGPRPARTAALRRAGTAAGEVRAHGAAARAGRCLGRGRGEGGSRSEGPARAGPRRRRSDPVRALPARGRRRRHPLRLLRRVLPLPRLPRGDSGTSCAHLAGRELRGEGDPVRRVPLGAADLGVSGGDLVPALRGGLQRAVLAASASVLRGVIGAGPGRTERDGAERSGVGPVAAGCG